MLTHTAKTLEWHSIKDQLEKLTISPLGIKEVNELVCYKTVQEVKTRLSETFEMTQILKESTFPTVEIVDLTSELDRCKAENSYLFVDELLRVATSLKGCREIRHHVLEYKDHSPNLSQIALEIETFKALEDNIFQAIDSTGKLSDRASPELRKIRQDIRHKKSGIEKALHQILRHRDNVHLIQDSIVTLRENRYVIPIKRDHKGKLKGIVLDTSNSGETLFIEPEPVVEKNNDLIALFKEEKEEEIRILKRFTKQIHDKLPLITASFKNIGILDLIYAKGKLALLMNGILPDINDQSIFKLFQVTHPLLKGEEIIPIDLLLGEDFDILIITGPNTGGKTVALKTLGLITMMAMSGLLIPAQEGSIISIVDSIYIDSGDEQSIEQNLSTYSGHIKRIIHILKHATRKSLVLIDELGAGTDPEEGSTLGHAVLNELREIGCKTIVTTHYAKMKSYPLLHKRVENASCKFDLETLSPSYKLIYGVSGKSNALDIARRLGLSNSIVSQAEKMMKANASPGDHLIDSVYQEKEKVAELSESYHDKLNELNLKEADLKSREAILKNELNELKELRLSEDLKTISSTRKSILKLFDKISSSPPDRKNLKDALKEIELAEKESRKAINELADDIPVVNEDHEWQIGDLAYTQSLSKTGKIITLSKSSVTLQVGDIKIKTNLLDLKVPAIGKPEYSSSSVKAESKEETASSYTVTDQSPPPELYLLGLRGDEAIVETEKYIESLYSSGMEKGRIIHGKGTGILRTIIENLLKDHPCIKSFHLARPEEGGYGVTEVFIK